MRPDLHSGSLGVRGNTSKARPARGEGHGGFVNPCGDTTDAANTLKDARTAREEESVVVTRQAQLESVSGL
jgi:hypothetical protein